MKSVNPLNPCLPAFACACVMAGKVETKERPIEGGRFVLRAWALLKSRGDSTIYDLEVLCDTSQNPRIGKIKTESYFVKVQPNPAYDHCDFLFNIPENIQGTLTIVNSLGQLVSTSTIPENSLSYHYSTKNNCSGIYFYHSTAGDKTIGSGKLIIIQ